MFGAKPAEAKKDGEDKGKEKEAPAPAPAAPGAGLFGSAFGQKKDGEAKPAATATTTPATGGGESNHPLHAR